MSDYKEMSCCLFREGTKAISRLQAAQQETEKLYMEDDPSARIFVLGTGDEDEKQPPLL